MDYDLEKFSHNPMHDRFGALPFKGTPLPNMRTTGSSRTKEYYCRGTKYIMDYDLEKFSHNPMHGRFGALPFKGTPLPNMRTTGSSRTKEYYCRGTKYIIRVKLTCITML